MKNVLHIDSFSKFLHMYILISRDKVVMVYKVYLSQSLIAPVSYAAFGFIPLFLKLSCKLLLAWIWFTLQGFKAST